MENKRKLVFTSLVPIRWGDMDTFGHVNNTVYFRFMEQCRIEWIESLGFAAQPGADAPVIIDASCTFLVPLTYPGTVEVQMFAGAPGRSSIPTYFEMRLQGDALLYAVGASKMVWTNTITGKSCPLPGRMREVLLRD